MPAPARSSEAAHRSAGPRAWPGLDHDWDVAPREAVAIQQRLRRRLILEGTPDNIRRVAGVDVGFESRGTVTRAAVAVLDAATLAPVEQALVRRPTTFPYIPGLLSFREIPAVLDALQGIDTLPDLILCDGHGIAHPRRLGIASHLGIITDIPCIGVGKSRLTGRHDALPQARGAQVPLQDGVEVIGTVLRSRTRVRPIYVSPGHRVDRNGAVRWVMDCLTRYRLPETTRAADRMASHGKS